MKALTEQVDEHHTFVLGSHQRVRSISELADALSEISDDEYAKHVEGDRNDFAAWIKHVYRDTPLANRLKEAKNRDEALLCLISALVGGHDVPTSPKKDKKAKKSKSKKNALPQPPAPKLPQPPQKKGFFGRLLNRQSAEPSPQETFSTEIKQAQQTFSNAATANEQLDALHDVQKAMNDRFLKLIEDAESHNVKINATESQLARMTQLVGDLSGVVKHSEEKLNEKLTDALQQNHRSLKAIDVVAQDLDKLGEKFTQSQKNIETWKKQSDTTRTNLAELAKLMAKLKQSTEGSLTTAVSASQFDAAQKTQQQKITHLVQTLHTMTKENEFQRKQQREVQQTVEAQRAEIAELKGAVRAAQDELKGLLSASDTHEHVKKKTEALQKEMTQHVATLRKETKEHMHFVLNELKVLQEHFKNDRHDAEERFMRSVVKALQERRQPPSLDSIKFHEIHDIKKAVSGLKEEIARIEKKPKKAKKKATKKRTIRVK